MSSIVCQRSQPCLDPLLTESRVSIHKSNPFESFPRNQEEHPKNSRRKNENSNGESGVWSFIQSLTDNSHNCKDLSDNNQVFVHPLAKRSAPALSEKSLEMCTESLGSETGSDISESSDEFPPFSPKIESSHSVGKLKSRDREFARKLIPDRSFPPPLTTISGSDSVQMRSHREGGRLVVKAVTVASSIGYFQADRADGRLRLCLVKNSKSLDYDNEQVDESDSRALWYYGDDGDGVDDDDGDDGMWVEGIGGNIGKGEGESGIGEIQRPSRCKEGGGQGKKRMSSWGPFLKALC